MIPDEQHLHAWMDGELDEATAQQVEHYLAKNPRLLRKCGNCVMIRSVYARQ